MKKNENKTSKYALIVLLLSMVALILVAGTYAKYTSKATGTDTARVAKWEVVLEDETLGVADADVEFDLFNEDVIYPGSEGSFSFDIQNKSEVAANYSIVFDTEGSTEIPLQYSFDEGDNKNWVDSLSNVSTTKLDADSALETVTVYWRWNPDSDDTADTTLGVDGGNVTVNATIVVEQAD